MVSRFTGALAGAFFFYVLPASATYVISNHYGGNVAEYIERYSNIRDTGGKVEVRDFCLSACTLVLAFIKPENLCATPGAVFGFHSAHTIGPRGNEFAKEATRLVWNIYPERVRQVLRDRGWDGDGDQAHPDLLYVPASEFVKTCGESGTE